MYSLYKDYSCIIALFSSKGKLSTNTHLYGQNVGTGQLLMKEVNFFFECLDFIDIFHLIDVDGL